MLLDDPDYDVLDVGYCPRCGRDMAGEPPTTMVCTSCLAQDEECHQ